MLSIYIIFHIHTLENNKKSKSAKNTSHLYSPCGTYIKYII